MNAYTLSKFLLKRNAGSKLMQEMFDIGKGHAIKETETIDLKAGILIDVHILDIGRGIKENLKKASPKDILSIPFSALLNGIGGINGLININALYRVCS